jgi:hypothetical protein
VIVPHFSNAYFASDPTHRTSFGLYSMAYFTATSPFARKVPTYGDPLPLELLAARLEFKAARPFYVRYAIHRLVQAVVNSTTWTQEFYEEALTGFVSCYQVRYRLRRLPAEDQGSQA